ncbi:MAG TPA: SDR family NAD(P)-dependent oxidoreductase [Acidimicrobiales bacterium]|nr:SDR family NAD(P)-dependent oxidoreductase [Acidimicrobiales bacterium]
MTADTKDLAPGCVLLLGGRSEIGLEVAQRIAEGRVVILAARRSAQLDAERQRMLDAGAAEVHCVHFDADETDTHAEFLARVADAHGPVGVAILAFGVLGDQSRAEVEPMHAVAIVHTDYVAQVGVLTTLANRLRAQGHGHIVVFSSVAGARVRRANYVYGSAKAGLDGFASGLADALHGTGVHLLLARPGFVIGRMTEGMSPAPMSSTPKQVAQAVVDGLNRRTGVVWIPRALGPAVFAMRMLPRALWRRMPR